MGSLGEEDNTKVKESTCPRVSVLKKIKGKIITKDQEKALKISHAIKIKEKRKVVKKKRMGTNKITHL